MTTPEPGDVCVECGNDEDVHPLPWLSSLNGPPTITFEVGFEGKRWHFFKPRPPSQTAAEEVWMEDVWPLVAYFRDEDAYEGSRADLDHLTTVQAALRLLRDRADERSTTQAAAEAQPAGRLQHEPTCLTFVDGNPCNCAIAEQRRMHAEVLTALGWTEDTTDTRTWHMLVNAIWTNRVELASLESLRAALAAMTEERDGFLEIARIINADLEAGALVRAPAVMADGVEAESP